MKVKTKKNQSKPTIFISDKIHFKPKVLRNVIRYYIMIKGSINQEDAIVIDTHPTLEHLNKYTKQILTYKGRNSQQSINSRGLQYPIFNDT